MNKDATQKEIQKAFYKLSKACHPDKGGEIEEFKKINNAYQTLYDPEKRTVYDAEQDPFSAIFGNIFGRKRPSHTKMQRGPDTMQDVQVGLADFYVGREIPISVLQQRCCVTCKATGSLKTESCTSCRGQGVRMQMRQLGPMIQQSTQTCTACNGLGHRIVVPCTTCHGKKYSQVEKILSARIVPGMVVGEKIRFIGECSESEAYERPGDIILTVSCVKEDFEWKGQDLHYTHSIDMAAMFLGFQLQLKNHPSGKDVTLNWIGGHYHPTMVVKGLGMPNKKGDYGQLYLHLILTIEKSPQWTVDQRQSLQQIFPTWTAPICTEDSFQLTTLGR